MKKLLFLGFYFTFTPIFLILSIAYFLFLTSKPDQILSQNAEDKVAYAALPSSSKGFNDYVFSNDARIDAVTEFFSSYKSELKPYADKVVNDADKYGIDYRLIPAIAMQESNLCKKAPKGSHNCWGYGIYGKNSIKFENYTQAITAVSKTLGEYKELGLVTPNEIMRKYTPSNTGGWAKAVNHFMNELSI